MTLARLFGILLAGLIMTAACLGLVFGPGPTVILRAGLMAIFGALWWVGRHGNLFTPYRRLCLGYFLLVLSITLVTALAGPVIVLAKLWR